MAGYAPISTSQPLMEDGTTTEEAPTKEAQEGEVEEEQDLFDDGPPAWWTGLQSVRSDSIDEMHIHVVPWESVAKECVLTAATILCLLIYLALGLANPILQALFFIGMFILVVIASELSVNLGPFALLAYAAIMLGVSALQAYLQHPSGPLDWLGKIPLILGTGLFVCSLVMILIGAWKGDLHTSDLFCAWTGKKKIRLDGKLDLAKLLKSLRVMKAEEEDQRAGWLGSWLKPKKPLTIGMIKSPEDEIPDANLELQGEMLPDSDYWLVGFTGLHGFGNIDDIKANSELITSLRELAAKNTVPKKIRFFLEPSINADEESLAVRRVRELFSESGLTEEPYQNKMVVLQRVDPVQGTWDHWAPRALFNSLVVALLSLPARLFVEEVVGMHQDLCADPTGAIHMPGGEVLCKDKTDCARICGDPMTYINAVTSSVYTSKAEALFVFILLPVYIFMTSVLTVREQHMSLELRYLKGMNRSRAAIREVLAFKSKFEIIRSISETCKNFWRRFAAWSPMSTGDPDLSALQSFDTELDFVRGVGVQNRVFEHVSKKMMALTAKHEVDGAIFWNGLYQREGNEMNAENKWQELMKMYQLGSTGRNYSISWTVLCKSNTSWELWKAWLENQSATLDCMMRSKSAQDGQPVDKGRICYLEEDLRIGNQLIPKGFSLAHIYCFDPEDCSEFVIELRKGASASIFEEAADTEQQKDETMRLLRISAVWDQISEMERMLTRYDTMERTLTRDGFGIALRFVVSEQFWSTLGSDPGLSQLQGKTMTDFITNVVKDTDCPAFSDVDDDNDMTQSWMTLVVGEVNPLQSVVCIVKVLLKRLMVVILTFLFMLIMPCFRVFVKGGKLFPEPFAEYLIGNAMCCAIILWCFFSMFQLTSERLSLVSSSLAEFEQKTLDPSGKAQKAKKDSKGQQPKKDSKEGAPEASPFDLTVTDSGHKYEPNGEGEDAEFFQQQWKEKQNNVRNWHYCIGYMRVVVSSSRLTAQAILVAAGLILAFLFLMSFLDAMAGKNGAEAAQFAHSITDQAKQAAGEMVEHAKARAKEAVDQTIQDIQGTRRLSLNLGMATEPISANSGSIEFTNATEVLQDLVQPVRHVLSFSIGRRLAGELDESEDVGSKALQDVENIRKKMLKAFDLARTITETQFVTVALVLLVLIYSVPLIYCVALINDSLDKHDNLLLVQKEAHRMNMANRQTDLTTKAAEPAEDSAADSSAANPSGKASDKDIGCRRYEKMLDMAIESAQTNKARFPVKLFGFIINMALLTTWITLALSPLAKQVQGMAPGLAMAACQWVENLDIIEQAEDMANHGVNKVNEGIDKANQGIEAVNQGMQQGLDKINKITSGLRSKKASPQEMEEFKQLKNLQHFDFQKMFHSYVCKPLTQMTAEQTAQAMSSFTNTRRLRSIEPLAPAVDSWWRAHPGDPHVKLLLVLSILNDLERSAMELSSAIHGDSHQIGPPEVWKPHLKPSLQPDEVLDDFQAWGKLHGVAHSIMSALEAEGVHNVDELAQLSAEEVDLLSRENTLGDRARFKLFVKSAQKASSKKFNEL